MAKAKTPQGPLTDEEYEGVKARFPGLEFNDADRTFISRQGNITSAVLLRHWVPIPKGGNEISRAGGQATKEKSLDAYRKYLLNLTTGMRITDAAKKAGLTYAAVKKQRERDPEFAQAEKDAEMQYVEVVETSLIEAAIHGNVPAAIHVLNKRAPERWPSEKMIVETKSTLELDATDHMKNILLLVEKLNQRAIASGDVIDVEAEEPNQLPRGDGE